jgi:lipoprotein-releasing system ATP-binding protein
VRRDHAAKMHFTGRIPTGNVDTATSASIHDLFFQINAARKTTIVVVTHNASFAERMPRIVHLRDGQVEKDLRRGAARRDGARSGR